MTETRGFIELENDPRTELPLPSPVALVVRDSARAITKLIRSVDGYRRRLAQQYGLSVTELRALSQIAESADATPRHLAEQLDLTSGSVTGLLDRLEGAGLVHRRPHPQDRRSVQVELTESGRATMAVVYARFQTSLLVAAEGLPAESVAAVNRFIELAAEGYDAGGVSPQAVKLIP